MIDSSKIDTTQDELIVVVLVSNDEIPRNATVVDATNESFHDIESLQRVLVDAENADKKTTVELCEEGCRQFVETTENVPRTPNEPGI